MATVTEADRGWRSVLPAGVRPYTEAAPIAAFFLGVSSGFPYAMIGATLTTRLKQDGIDKSTITAFALVFLVILLVFITLVAFGGATLLGFAPDTAGGIFTGALVNTPSLAAVVAEDEYPSGWAPRRRVK